MTKIKYNEDAAALNWEIVNGLEDIGLWKLWYKEDLIEGSGIEEFINAASNLSLDLNVVFAKRLKWLVVLMENYVSFKDKTFFANGEKEFYHIQINDNLELRNWDNFWKKEDNGEMFIKKLEMCRGFFNHGEGGQRNKNRLSLKDHYKFTLSKEMWRDIKNQNFLYQSWARNFCQTLAPQDEEEWNYMSCPYFNKAGFYYRNEDYIREVIPEFYCYDISSAYLSFLIRKPYPMESFQWTEDPKEIQKIIKEGYYCWYGEFNFYGLEYKHNFHFDISRFGQPIEHEMNSWSILLTNVDIEWMKILFKWDSVCPGRLYYTKQRILDRRYANMFDRLYQAKAAQPKGTFAKEISKTRAELVYGQPIKAVEYPSKTIYEESRNDFIVVDNDKELSFSQIQNELNGRGIPMYVGLWTVAYARQEFVKVLSKIGFENVIYGDTDSVKFVGKEGIKIIEEHNETIRKEMKEMTRRHGIIPHKDMGLWLNEGRYRNFKSLEIKMYYCEKFNEKENKWEMEVKAAGADSDKIINYLKTKRNPVMFFTLNMKVPEMRYTIEQDKRTISLIYEDRVDKEELFKTRKRETALYNFKED